MAHKEEDTVVLLSPIEVEEEPQKEGSSPPRCPFAASGMSSALLCGAGIFIAHTIMWCRDPRENCNDSEIFRFTALFGGILSSLIVGRVMDYYGRRSSLMISALFWIVVTVLMVLLPSHTEIPVNSYDAPLSKFYIWPTELRSSVEYAPAYTIETYDTEVSVAHIISYSYSQNSSFGNNLFPTQPTPIKSVSIPNYGSYLNATLAENDNLSVKSFSPSKGKMVEYSSVKPVLSTVNLNRSSYVVLLLIFHVFLGGASAASVVAVTVYTYETSSYNSQAQWISLSDFFSSLCILSLPVIHEHLILLIVTAWLPLITLAFLMLIPINLPDCLSLPHSPQFLLLSVITQRRNSLFSNSLTHTKENKGVSKPSKDIDNIDVDKFTSFFQTYGNTNLRYTKIPFKKAKIKIHDASSKSSASDSDDSSSFFNDKLKHVVLDSTHEHLQSVNMENEEGTGSIHYQQSEMTFPAGVCDYICATLVENVSGADKKLGRKTNLCVAPEESGNLIEGAVEEEECSWQVSSESNEIHDGYGAQGERATLVQPSFSDSLSPLFSWQERESLRILSYLNGEKEGYMEWKNIKKVVKEDITGIKYSAKNTFFHFDIPSFCPTLYIVIKVGLPLMIIHMFSCDYGTVVTMSETILSKLGFCDLSGPAAITSLQVVSSGTSVLILDKLRNQVVLKSAAIVMTASLIILGFLHPSIQKTVDNEQLSFSKYAVTPNSALPTLYPLLPTPLPQVLQGQENICSDSLVKSTPSQAWDQVGVVQDSQKNIPLSSAIIWFSALVLVLYVLVSSLVLLPLTRLVLVSCFPIDKRGIGVGISISIQWVLRLIMIFFPQPFLNSGLGFLVYAAASFSSILLLCVASSEFFSRNSFFQQTNMAERISHHSSNDKIYNLSDINSTAV